MKGRDLRETVGLIAVVTSLGVYFQHINVLQAAYRQVQAGAVERDDIGVFWTGLLSLDYIAEAWPSMRYSYDPEFADFFEELLASVPRSRAPRDAG